jgi:uncharacterized phage-like protein YoqJ
MKPPEEIDRFRTKMIEHMEAALALADETGDGAAGYMIEAALDTIRAEDVRIGAVFVAELKLCDVERHARN